jgi:tRNA threonylcarbamoyladenosine biosynthesis protein TsaE
MPLEIVTSSAEETIRWGREFAARVSAPAVILLSGDLGSGKTTLAKGIVAGLGAAREEDVTSPTFTLVHLYPGDPPVYHADLYRVEGVHDLETLGLEDVFSKPAILLVEWSERFAWRSDWPTFRLHLEHLGEDRRKITVLP